MAAGELPESLGPKAAGELTGSLRAKIAALAREDAAAVLEEARVEARRRAREALAEALTRALLEQASTAPGAQERVAQRPVRAQETAPASAPTPVGTPRPPDPAPAGDARAWYVYGIVPAEPVPDLAGVAGIDPDGELVTVVEGSLCALTSPVPMADFEEDRLRERLTELDWVERVARAHERVLDAFLPTTTVIPLRMCTVLRSVERVREMLRRERPLLEQAMADLSGCWEWGVKVFLSPDMAVGGGGPAGDGEPDGGAVRLDADGDTGAATRAEDRGTQYMARRRAERDRREAAERRAAETGERIHAQLTRFAHDARSTPPQPPEASGHPGLMVLNGVYLIDRVRTDGFHALVESLHERHSGDGIELVTSGPWPPYNFLPGLIGATA